MTGTQRLPQFLIVGAMKSGTTTLQAQLAAQAGIFMTTPKEPNFFSDDPVFARGMDWYQGLYDGAAPGDLRGEASTHYTKLPTWPRTVARLAAAVPSPRLIYVLRDPVARAVSHYLHEWTEGRMGGDPVAAFAAHPELVEYGRYAMQIRPYVAEFGSGAVHLTSLELLTSDPQGELDRIAAHIGAAQPLVWDHGLGAQNVSAARSRRLPLHGLLVDNPVATALRRALVPKAVRARIREARAPKARPEPPAELRHRLEAAFLQDRADLATLFPGHPVLGACYPFAAA